jgi:hypothetical protein
MPSSGCSQNHQTDYITGVCGDEITPYIILSMLLYIIILTMYVYVTNHGFF